jgi:hypothetical protein
MAKNRVLQQYSVTGIGEADFLTTSCERLRNVGIQKKIY